MNLFRILILIPLLLLLPNWLTSSGSGWADVSGAQQEEVQHLLAFIRESGCQMERNGKPHSPEEAQRHMTLKYHLFRSSITQTKDFIEKAASRSVFSGRSYLMLCLGREPQPTAEWLKQELERFREEQAAPLSLQTSVQRGLAQTAKPF